MTTPPHSRAATRTAAAVVLAAAVLSGCDVGWGGARVELEEPAPPPRPADDGDAAPISIPPLPRPPLLYVAELDPDGSARAVPAARLGPGGLEPLGWPEEPPDPFLDRFAGTFQSPGAELPLLAEGGRAGTLILGERRSPVNARCPAVSGGRIFLSPGGRVPPWSFARTPADGGELEASSPAPSTNSRIRTFAPILAERLLRDAGVARPFLARRADLQAVTFPGDTAPGMAATYVINDSLAASPPPGGTSASLFFLARFDRSEGFVPVWTRVRSYSGAAEKEILAWMGWIRTAAGPTHLVRRVTADGFRLAAFRPEGESGELAWIEPAACPALEALLGHVLSGAGGAGGAEDDGGEGRLPGGAAPDTAARPRPPGSADTPPGAGGPPTRRRSSARAPAPPRASRGEPGP